MADTQHVEFNWSAVAYPVQSAWMSLVAVSVVLVSIAAYLGYTGNYFGAALFALFPPFLLANRMRGPRTMHCAITGKGVRVNGSLYPYDELKSFDILDGEELVLTPKEGGAVHLPLFSEDEGMVEDALSEHLARAEHEEGLSEIVGRALRLH